MKLWQLTSFIAFAAIIAACASAPNSTVSRSISTSPSDSEIQHPSGAPNPPEARPLAKKSIKECWRKIQEGYFFPSKARDEALLKCVHEDGVSLKATDVFAVIDGYEDASALAGHKSVPSKKKAVAETTFAKNPFFPGERLNKVGLPDLTADPDPDSLGGDTAAYLRSRYLRKLEVADAATHVATNRYRSLNKLVATDLTRSLVNDRDIIGCTYVGLRDGLYCWRKHAGEPFQVAAAHQEASPELSRARQLVGWLAGEELAPAANAVIYTTYLQAEGLECASYRFNRLDVRADELDRDRTYSAPSYFVSSFRCFLDGKAARPPWRPRTYVDSQEKAYYELWDIFRHGWQMYVLVRSTYWAGEGRGFELFRVSNGNLVEVFHMTLWSL